MVGDDEDAVGDGDDGSLVAAPLDQPPVLGREVAVACADGAPGALDERRAQRPVGPASAAAQALAGALVIARAKAVKTNRRLVACPRVAVWPTAGLGGALGP